jgi:hypothetical protein
LGSAARILALNHSSEINRRAFGAPGRDGGLLSLLSVLCVGVVVVVVLGARARLRSARCVFVWRRKGRALWNRAGARSPPAAGGCQFGTRWSSHFLLRLSGPNSNNNKNNKSPLGERPATTSKMIHFTAIASARAMIKWAAPETWRPRAAAAARIRSPLRVVVVVDGDGVGVDDELEDERKELRADEQAARSSSS